MSNIRKFGPLFNVLTVLRAVFRVVFGFSARSRRGIRTGLAKWATDWAPVFGVVRGWYGWLAGEGARLGHRAGCRLRVFVGEHHSNRLLRLAAGFCTVFLLSATICHQLEAEFASSADRSPISHQNELAIAGKSP